MLFRSAVLLLTATAGFASAGIAPELFIGVSSRTDASDLTGSLEPSIKWTTGGSVGDYCDYEGGLNMRAADGEVPFSVWGSLRKSVRGWNLKAKVDAESDNLNSVDFDVQADGGPTSLLLRAAGNVDAKAKSVEVTEVGLKQSFDAPGGDLSFAPNYNIASRKADVRVEYAVDDTRITVDADMDKQKVTVARRINSENSIAPSITSEGDVELEYRRVIRDGVLTANYRPNDSTSFKYEEGPWVAKADVPMDGFYKLSSGTKFSIRRSIAVEAM